MAISLRNFFCKNAIQLHCRFILTPSLQKSITISTSCSKCRHYSASIPEKYIPMKPLNSVESKTASLSAKNLVDIGKYNCVNLNSKSAELHDGMEEEVDGVLGVDNSEFLEEPEEIGLETNVEHASRQDVERVAIQLLAARALTAVELKKKLQGKKFPFCTIDSVITDLCTRGLINDCLYAETYTRSRWSSSSWGPLRIKQALVKKGVNEMDVDRAIKLVFKDDETAEEHESGFGMPKLSLDHLLVQASKQWLRSRDVPRETRKSRVIRWLQYRGFNWSVITFVLKKLESKHPS